MIGTIHPLPMNGIPSRMQVERKPTLRSVIGTGRLIDA